MRLGLLFACRLGNVELDRPVGARAAGLTWPTPLARHLGSPTQVLAQLRPACAHLILASSLLLPAWRAA